MNWERFQTYGQSSEKSFEMLCNQLFENWCKEECKDTLASFVIVNGAGGDGGVESYAVLKDGSIIGLQAKWFRTSIQNSQINQIKGSIETAKKVRPQIKKYIVCVPRDLASLTGKGKNHESARWENLVFSIKGQYPDLDIELWNDSKITVEMQKPTAAGIHKYWFFNSEIAYDNISYAFSKAKNSWLSTKYVPDLNVAGKINRSLQNYVGEFETKEGILNQLTYIIKLCDQFEVSIQELISVCHDACPDIIGFLEESQQKICSVKSESQKMFDWIKNEFAEKPSLIESSFSVSFQSIIRGIKDSKVSYTYHFHISDVTSILQKLSKIDFYSLCEAFSECLNDQCLLFLGNPGTGKTQGISAFTDKLLAEQYHIPIVIQARDIPEAYTWKDILIYVLGCSASWNEEELWQALISAANRNRFQESILQKKIAICPKILIIVDGIDESSSQKKWIERIKETSSITERYDQIRFCFASRPAPFAAPVTYAKVIHLSDSGDTPAHKLFDNYVKAYDISIQNCQWIKYSLNTPLGLKLFCELYKGQIITIADLSEVSMNQLWRKRIEKIQAEFDEKEDIPSHNQYIIISITALSVCFTKKTRLERSEIVEEIKEKAKVDSTLAEKIVDHLESYGVIGSFCKQGKGLSPDTYLYYAGIQGYFDYASAMYLIEKYSHPSLIDFKECEEIDSDALYCLAIISIQQYQYLITDNPTIEKIDNYFMFPDLQFYALQHSAHETGIQYKEQIIKIMQSGAEGTTTVVNNLILPLSRIKEHPLGVSLLDKFLNGFEKPAQRDVVWSLPPNLHNSEGEIWGKDEAIALTYDDDEEYCLTSEDLSSGLPTVYAWMLSNVDNRIRKECRDKLMVWAQVSPWEFYKLFLHFANVNDPQIKSDIYSIMMCLVYDCNDEKLIREVSGWILENVLAPSIIDKTRDISVRYYAIAIVQKAKVLGLYADDDVENHLPPYNADNIDIELNKDALSGSRMGGYSAIHYDLARYVLIDHITLGFYQWKNRQLDNLLFEYTKHCPDYEGITVDQFVLSAAYAYILQMGWNKEEFYNYSKDESGNSIGGVDCSISGSYYSADHGAKSQVMTVCEKYVWAARNIISGFLCDRLLFGDDQIQVTDYNMLDSFPIPIQEIFEKDPDNLPDDSHLYIPEPPMVFPEEEFKSKELVVTYIKNAPEIDWNKWIHVDNTNYAYSVAKDDLLALNMSACFHGLSGVETMLFIDSVVIPQKDALYIIEKMHNKSLFDRICNPDRWVGGVESSCYISPKEICWFSWKKHYNCDLSEEFPRIDIQSAIDKCFYSSQEYGDIHYYMPSATLRTLLGITDTNGYQYYNNCSIVAAEYSKVGESWRTSQEFVLVGKDCLMQKLKEKGLTLIWLMQELRRETGNAKERYGEFYAERRQYYIGYYKDDRIVFEKMLAEFSQK